MSPDQLRAIWRPLPLLTPVSLPEQARVRIQILTQEEIEDNLALAEAVLVASGLVRPTSPTPGLKTVSQDRRAELARFYAAGGPLSEIIIAERDAR